jgi:hypothetical protein
MGIRNIHEISLTFFCAKVTNVVTQCFRTQPVFLNPASPLLWKIVFAPDVFLAIYHQRLDFQLMAFLSPSSLSIYIYRSACVW